MSRILKRPMFRKGGSVGEGIMSKVQPRQNYQMGNRVKQIYEDIAPLYMQAVRPTGQDDTMANLLIRGGLNLVAGSDKDAPLLQTVASAYKEPTEQALKEVQQRKLYEPQARLAALGAATKIASAKKKAFASETFAEQVKNKQNFYKGSALTPKVALKFSRNAIKEVRAERALGTKFYGPVDKIETATAIAKQSPEGTVFLDVDRSTYFIIRDGKIVPASLEEAISFNLKK